MANLTKIPTELPKSPAEQHIQQLNKLSKIQLLEIKDRQEKLLANRSRISKLPDKGKRIQDFYDKILKELADRDQVEKAASIFSELNIASTGQRQLTSLEWTGKCDSGRGEIILDSDDEEEINPLKIISQSTNVQRKVKYVTPEKSLVTEEDLREIETFKGGELEKTIEESVVAAEIVDIDVSDKIDAIRPKLEHQLIGVQRTSSKNSSANSLDLDPHVLYLFEKGVDAVPQEDRFKPFKTTKTNVHDPEKEMQRKPLGKHWEVTAATPPPLQHAGVKMLSLQDSVEIQAEYLMKLKKLQEHRAEERERAKADRLRSMGVTLPQEGAMKFKQFFGSHRDTGGESSDSEVEEVAIDSDEGVRDDEEEKGGVNYVVYK